MPALIVQKYATEKGVSIKEAEKKWKEAKELTKKQDLTPEKDGGRYWAYVMSIFKNMMGIPDNEGTLNHILNGGSTRGVIY